MVAKDIFYALAFLSVVLSLLVVSIKQLKNAAICLFLQMSVTAGIILQLELETLPSVLLCLHPFLLLLIFLFSIKRIGPTLTRESSTRLGKLEFLSLGFIVLGLIMLLQPNTHAFYVFQQGATMHTGKSLASIPYGFIKEYKWQGLLISILIGVTLLANRKIIKCDLEDIQ